MSSRIERPPTLLALPAAYVAGWVARRDPRGYPDRARRACSSTPPSTASWSRWATSAHSPSNSSPTGLVPTRATSSALIDQLEHRGLIQRAADPADRRRHPHRAQTRRSPAPRSHRADHRSHRSPTPANAFRFRAATARHAARADPSPPKRGSGIRAPPPARLPIPDRARGRLQVGRAQAPDCPSLTTSRLRSSSRDQRERT